MIGHIYQPTDMNQVVNKLNELIDEIDKLERSINSLPYYLQNVRELDGTYRIQFIPFGGGNIQQCDFIDKINQALEEI